MLVLSDIREKTGDYVSGLEKRGLQNARSLLTEVIAEDDRRKALQQELDQSLAKANQMAKSIGKLMQEGRQEDAEVSKAETKALKEQSKALSEQLQSTENHLRELLYDIPNVPNALVAPGAKEEDNEVVLAPEVLPSLDGNARPHWDLLKDFDLIDFELGNKVAGAGFPFYKGKGARLVRAMVNYFLDEALKENYIEVQPPILVNEASGLGTGQLPDKEGQMYGIEDTDLFLIPTAEVPITNMYRDVILDKGELPVKHVGYTPCFRREAGSWGSHVRGLNRLHQFDKVEIVQIAQPTDSYEILDRMVQHVERLIKALELPYRILRLCGGDLGFTSAITYDFEVYSAAQEKWLEVSSVSNFETYQANRLKLRYKDSDGKKQLAHTLNGSALAIPRILAAILENNQTANGIKIPLVLVPYTGFSEIH